MKVEVEWLKYIGSEGMILLKSGKKMHFSDQQTNFLDNLFTKFADEDASRIKSIEQTTNHDVKAVEYYIKEKINGFHDSELQEIKEYVHFCCTSEDINNLAYSLMLTDGKNKILLPLKQVFLIVLSALATEFCFCLYFLTLFPSENC